MIIGIIGGGQLAKMMVLAGYPMGQEFIILDPSPDAAAGRVAKQIIGAYDDPVKLRELADAVDVITFDFENVPADAVRELAKWVPVFPNAHALEIAQDRNSEKQLFAQLGMATAPYRIVDSLSDLERAIHELGLPAILKTRRMGYDGKGQQIIRNAQHASEAWHNIGEQPAILEGFVAFDNEVSLIAVRGRNGEHACYPLVQNVHKNGILNISTAPYENSELQTQAENFAARLVKELDYVGVIAVEFFVHNKQLIANEMAPRVHNTGHWTIEGASVSQFENHLRAITGLPLGDTEAHSYAAMINFISTLPNAEDVLRISGCHFHDYGKAPRPGRKLGHATLRASTPAKLQEKIAAIKEIVQLGD
ncbi:MAG: 5-(carboxyamino)imidazole ribonucleotide synthase [Gammaproteobacteria bacterium]|nr:5-(carboxyamino)imidazole ribonucleotide synthase [Gammaproteobacteria bacterium]